MSVSVSIVFTGLCALVGNGDGRPADVLLLDVRGVGEVRGVALPAHAPTLVVSLNDLANPDTSAPTRVVVGRTSRSGRPEQLGLWDLAGMEVRIRAQGSDASGVRFFRPEDGQSAWPEPPDDVLDASAWRDIRYIADMAALVGDGRIDPALVETGGETENTLPRSIAARIRLDAGLFEAGIPSQASYRSDRFAFPGGDQATPQALTDTVQWSLESSAAAIAIDIVPVSGGSPRRLLLAPSENPHRLFVSNLPGEEAHTPRHAFGAEADEHPSHYGISEAEMAALHFGAYYALLRNEPGSRPLPAVWHSATESGTGLLRPIICPPALFSR